ncbi:hypothetical protein P9112_009810 [Eukaryota sp. TZLM1-RC]
MWKLEKFTRSSSCANDNVELSSGPARTKTFAALSKEIKNLRFTLFLGSFAVSQPEVIFDSETEPISANGSTPVFFRALQVSRATIRVSAKSVSPPRLASFVLQKTNFIKPFYFISDSFYNSLTEAYEVVSKVNIENFTVPLGTASNHSKGFLSLKASPSLDSELRLVDADCARHDGGVTCDSTLASFKNSSNINANELKRIVETGDSQMFIFMTIN